MILIFFLCMGLTSLLADEEETHDISFTGLPTPWFTGPLIALSGFTVKQGHINVQPYFDFFVNVGFYDADWKASPAPNFYEIDFRLPVRVGVLNWFEIKLVPRVSYHETEERHSSGFNDLLLDFSIQLLTFGIEDPWPAIKLVLGILMPSGKYQKLNPSLKFTDAMGFGCWYPELGVVFSKLWHLSGIHYVEARLFSVYRIGTPTSAKGLSVYGGDSSTRGTVYPGNFFITDGAIQINLTQQVAFACDFFYLHRDRSRFSGRGTKAGRPSREQFSLAPALEYNWSKNLGMIGGIWFSLAGRNHPEFINGLLSFEAYF